MLDANELQNITLDSLETGHDYVARIGRRVRRNMAVMRQTSSNELWQSLSDENYELSKAKLHIQHAMGKLVSQARRQR